MHIAHFVMTKRWTLFDIYAYVYTFIYKVQVCVALIHFFISFFSEFQLYVIFWQLWVGFHNARKILIYLYRTLGYNPCHADTMLSIDHPISPTSKIFRCRWLIISIICFIFSFIIISVICFVAVGRITTDYKVKTAASVV